MPDQCYVPRVLFYVFPEFPLSYFDRVHAMRGTFEHAVCLTLCKLQGRAVAFRVVGRVQTLEVCSNTVQDLYSALQGDSRTVL